MRPMSVILIVFAVLVFFANTEARQPVCRWERRAVKVGDRVCERHCRRRIRGSPVSCYTSKSASEVTTCSLDCCRRYNGCIKV